MNLSQSNPYNKGNILSMIKNRRPHTPGEILNALYLTPHNISITEFAKACGVTRKYMSDIVNGHVSITTEMSVRMAIALNTSVEYWINLQNNVDLCDIRVSQ